MTDKRDPLTDPRPGDVILITPGWTRSIDAIENGRVLFSVEYKGNKSSGYEVSLIRWELSLEDIGAEVLHAAD